MFTFDLDQELPPMGPGLRVSFPLHSATGTASTATVLFELDPGAELPVHTDSAEELLIVVQGTGEARVGDDVARITKHDVALVPPMAPHGLKHRRRRASHPRHVLQLDRRLDIRAAVGAGRAASVRDRIAGPGRGSPRRGGGRVAMRPSYPSSEG